MNEKMNELLIESERNLNAEEQKYHDRFIEQMGILNYIPMPGEKFKQMLLTEGDHKVYNPYCFVSNYGNVFSVSETHKTIYRMKPLLITGCSNNNSKDNASSRRWTEHIKNNYEKWETDYNRGWIPQYYFTLNGYANKHFDKWNKLLLHRLVAVYFLPNGERAITDDYSVHHIKPFDWNKNPQFSNAWTNLQILPRSLHNKMHGIANNVIEQRESNVTIGDNSYKITIIDNTDGEKDYIAEITQGVADLAGIKFKYHMKDGEILWIECEQ